MKTSYLFPYKYKKYAWVFLGLSVIFGLSLLFINDDPEFSRIYFDSVYKDGEIYQTHINFIDEIVMVILIVSSLLVAFSREKQEDEYISKIRLESLVWATYVNYGLLILAIVFVYGFAFLNVMLFNMFTLLLFFIIRFNIYKFKLKKQLSYEE